MVKMDNSLGSSTTGYRLVSDLYLDCLFFVPDLIDNSVNLPPKCKKETSRAVAFKLLIELVKQKPKNYQLLLALVEAQIDSVKLGNNYEFCATTGETNKFGYLGVVNQGATCYMNSLLQQLYMNPDFRAHILQLKLTPDLQTQDSLIYQLQILFTTLQESTKKYSDTRDFCKCYKVEGKPVNTSVQMDSWEFFNNLLDEIETKMKPTQQHQFLQEMFGGYLANQFIGSTDSCNHRREVLESFKTISVEVKGKENLYDALKLFIQGEMVSGVFCEQCQQNVDTMKRCVLKDLPSTLIIHLKRFDFDYQTMSRIKLNSMLEFPMDLNMESFTKEGVAKAEGERIEEQLRSRTPAYYMYELVGVVVHCGSLDYGHYYSYIKERIPLRGTECQWFEFNDIFVKPWNPNQLREDCFGGEEFTRWSGGTSGKGAYLLVYQRKIPLNAERAKGLEDRKAPPKRTRSQGEINDDLEKERKAQTMGNEGLRRSRSKQDLSSARSPNASKRTKQKKKKKKKKKKYSALIPLL
eukprot:TRINITY_DN6691_c0_g1_i10.p2 TRINITY_DN6691_c0_g1~~TRINITY_DN6691_c0_g1_i10.p2  ORF type:complete len:522 (+),score=113.38 TRINITY_DN6691_c0_g1_i10:3766-5331(+)